jgi:hypothetical protein
MKIKWNKRVLALSVLLSIASVAGAVAYNGALQKKSMTYYEPAKQTEAPRVVSSAPGLQINEVRLINQGTDAAAIEIDVINNRESALMSIDFITKNRKTSDSAGMAMDGLADKDNPQSIMAPHSLRTFTMYLSSMIGEPVFLAAAVYEDGKEEGDKKALENLRSGRSHDQLKKKAEKQNGGQP